MLLTTSEALNAELGTSGVDYETMIQQWSSAIELYCGGSFDTRQTTMTRRYDRPRDILLLDQTPCIAVAVVTIDDEPVTTFEVDDAEAGFLRRVDNGRPTPWPAGKIAVTYTAGYTSVPPGVERCCLDLCVRAYHARGRDPALRSERILDVIDQSWVDPDKTALRGGLPADVADRLDAYRVVPV